MAPAKINAIIAPLGPPTIWPIQTTNAVNTARRIVVRKPFIAFPPILLLEYPTKRLG